MKKLFVLTILLFSFYNVNAQTEKDSYKLVANKFVAFFNENKTDSIVAMFSQEMITALPLDKFSNITDGIKLQLGNISLNKFLRYQNGGAFYQTTFERGVLGMTITLNNKLEIAGLLFKPYDEAKEIVRNTTKMQLPFKGLWTVYWGGDNMEQNYHVDNTAQKNAFDIFIYDEKGSTHKGTGASNEDYYCFGEALYAPCDGEVVLVVDGIKDNVPGTLNPVYVPGNTVIIKTATGEYVFMAHFKQNSIVVKQNQIIKVGEKLGLTGNSGNSSEPHLHFHLQNVEDMIKATGAKCFFDQLKVNGVLKLDYSPVKGDKIEAIF